MYSGDSWGADYAGGCGGQYASFMWRRVGAMLRQHRQAKLGSFARDDKRNSIYPGSGYNEVWPIPWAPAHSHTHTQCPVHFFATALSVCTRLTAA